MVEPSISASDMKLPRIPLPPDGQDFAELMALEKIGENTFKSASMPCPGGPRIFDGKLYISTFGGHVYAQAAWAAAQTVPDGFVIHVCALCFIVPSSFSLCFIRKMQSHLLHFHSVFKTKKENGVFRTCLIGDSIPFSCA